MIRYGTISELLAGKARVKFDGEEGVVSAPLPIAVPLSLGVQFQFPFAINQHVACMMDENCENGVILCAIYDEGNTPVDWDKDKVQMIDTDQGLTVTYNRSTKELLLTGQANGLKLKVDIPNGDVEVICKNAKVDASVKVEVEGQTIEITSASSVDIVAPTKVTIDSPEVECTQHLKVASIEVAGTSGITIDAAGNLHSPSLIEGNQVKQGSIFLGLHKHSGVTTGGGVSGFPTP